MPPLAQAMLAQGQFKKLIDEFAGKDLPLPAAKAELLTALATAYMAIRNQDLAKSTLDAALAGRSANYVPAQLLAVRRQAGGGDLDGAIAAIDAHSGQDADQPRSAQAQGRSAGGKNMPDEAIAAYRKAIDIKPDFLSARLAVLNILMAQGKLDDAAKELDAVKKQAPNNPRRALLRNAAGLSEEGLQEGQGTGAAIAEGCA